VGKSRRFAALGKQRWAGLTPEQRRAEMAKIQALRDMSPQKRKAIGKALAEARKAKRRKDG
jgi:hypothetical protein